jgi:hypothetical protein
MPDAGNFTKPCSYYTLDGREIVVGLAARLNRHRLIPFRQDAPERVKGLRWDVCRGGAPPRPSRRRYVLSSVRKRILQRSKLL